MREIHVYKALELKILAFSQFYDTREKLGRIISLADFLKVRARAHTHTHTLTRKHRVNKQMRNEKHLKQAKNTAYLK